MSTARRANPEAERQARVDRLIAECDDVDLDLLKPMALNRIDNPTERERLSRWSVRVNNWLRQLVYDVLTEGIPLEDVLRADATSKRKQEQANQLFS